MNYLLTAILYTNSFIFLLLALIHVYWAFGGKWATKNVLPTTDKNVAVLHPRPLGTLVVALFLIAFAVSMLYAFAFPKYVLLGIAALFLLRAIGDFKYVGIFKRVRTTVFANSDTCYFVPLCVYLSVSCLYVYWQLYL